jgi:tetratricopeptide (TPR) repeat protein
MGQLLEAQDFFERAIKLARNVGARNFEADALSRLVAVSLGQGNKIKAQQLAKQAVEIVRQVGMTFIGPAVLVELAATTDNVSERWAALAAVKWALRPSASGCELRC